MIFLLNHMEVVLYYYYWSTFLEYSEISLQSIIQTSLYLGSKSRKDQRDTAFYSTIKSTKMTQKSMQAFEFFRIFN